MFVPYRPEVGPAGSVAGIIGCLFVIFLIDKQDNMRSNQRVIVEWLLFLMICFTVGLFPGIDNYANIFGFIMGVLLSIGLLPYIGHDSKPADGNTEPRKNSHDTNGNHSSKSNINKCRLIAFLLSMLSAIALLVILFVLLYVVPFQCDWCGYLDCVPFTPDLCAEQQTSFERHMIIT